MKRNRGIYNFGMDRLGDAKPWNASPEAGVKWLTTGSPNVMVARVKKGVI